MKTFLLRRAAVHELGTVRGLIGEAAEWLRREKATDQWQVPWPSPEGRTKRMTEDIESGKTWLAWDGRTAAATITVEYEESPNLPRLWTWEDDGPAVSVHRAAVSRRYAGLGLGAALFNWVGEQAACCGRKWIRIDVWTDNKELHKYYQRQHFEFVRYYEDPAYPSGALFQRLIADAPEAAGVALVTWPACVSRPRR